MNNNYILPKPDGINGNQTILFADNNVNVVGNVYTTYFVTIFIIYDNKGTLVDTKIQ